MNKFTKIFFLLTILHLMFQGNRKNQGEDLLCVLGAVEDGEELEFSTLCHEEVLIFAGL